MKLGHLLTSIRVGGPIGENNFKFFILFTGYAALYCIHIGVVMAIYVYKQNANPVCQMGKLRMNPNRVKTLTSSCRTNPSTITSSQA